MAEQETENIVAEETKQVEETQETTENKIQEVPDDKIETTGEIQNAKEEPESSFISRIKAKFAGKQADEAADEGDDIPDEFVEAARKMNWSDEDTTSFASGMKQDKNGNWIASDDDVPLSDEQLREMIPSLLGEDLAKAEETSDKVDVKPETTEKTVEDSQDGDELEQLRKDIAALKEAQGISEEQAREREAANFNSEADKLFDKASEEFEVFGKTEDLPRFPHNGEIIPTSPQMKARLEVYSNAMLLKEAGMSGKAALDYSLNAYKGANLKIETKRSVIKELKKREQTLGGKRVSHETTEAANLTGPEVIAEVKRSYGK